MAKKCRLIWDYCTPTRERRPTTVKDIEEDIFVKTYLKEEDMLYELIGLLDFDSEDLDFELDAPLEEQIEELLTYFNDPGDGSPNILYCSIDGKELEGTLPYDCLIDCGLNLETCTRRAVIDCIKSSYDEEEWDYEYESDRHFSEDVNTAYEDEDEDEDDWDDEDLITEKELEELVEAEMKKHLDGITEAEAAQIEVDLANDALNDGRVLDHEYARELLKEYIIDDGFDETQFIDDPEKAQQQGKFYTQDNDGKLIVWNNKIRRWENFGPNTPENKQKLAAMGYTFRW